MHIEVISKRVTYRLDIKGKYSVIQGDSGVGKTTLCRLLQNRTSAHGVIKVKCDIPIVALNNQYFGTELSGINNSVVVIDEGCTILQQDDVAKILQESDNYFVIVSRSVLDFLPLCVENLYDMKTNGRFHWIEPRYHVSEKKRFARVEHIVTEDSSSGLEFFKHHYGIDAQSAHSKSEIVKYLSEQLEKASNFNDVLVVYDAAAFAYNKAYLDEWVLRSGLRVQMLDWYSFEHYVLTQIPFNLVLTQDEIGKEWESLEQASTDYLGRFICYSKGHLAACLKQESSCNGCRKVDNCMYKHAFFTPDLQIESKTETKTNRLGAF